jgi:hypothetical protein
MASPLGGDILATSQQLENANKLLEQYRKRDGVIYHTPALPVAGQSPDTPDTAVSQTVKAYPSLLNAFHKKELVPVGRVYMLIRAMDKDGRGRVPVSQLRDMFTGPGSPWRIFTTWKRLRQVLNQGEGICWQRDPDGDLRIYGPHRIAQALECGRLRGQPVELPVKELLKGIQATKAQFYTCLHSGRPITQKKLRELTGIPQSTQRLYNQVAGVKSQKNICVNDKEPYNRENVQRRAWQQGRNVFRFYVRKGKLRGLAFVAWRLPSSYESGHAVAPKGRQKKVNQAIALVMNRERGNNEKVERLYHPDNATAGAAYNRSPEHDHYYPVDSSIISDRWRNSRLASAAVWGVLPGSKKL